MIFADARFDPVNISITLCEKGVGFRGMYGGGYSLTN
jgi:hypothetical protein